MPADVKHHEEIQKLIHAEQRKDSKSHTLLFATSILALFAIVVLFLTVFPQILVHPQQMPQGCGADFSCFIRASADCTPATVLHTTTFPFGAVQPTLVSQMEIQGMQQSGNCLFYIKTEHASLVYDSSVPPEIAKQGNDAYAALAGKNGTCLFKSGDLHAMLLRWNDGNFSLSVSCDLNASSSCTVSGDWAVATECRGDYWTGPNL